MALMTASATKDKHFVVYRKGSSGLDPGRHVRVRGTVVPDWLKAIATETREPFPDDPDAIHLVDGEQEIADERRLAEQAAAQSSDRLLTKEELWRKLPWTRDAHLYQLAVTQYEFPAAFIRCLGHSFTAVSNHWSESAIDRWLAAQRAKLEQLRVFVG